MSVHDFWDGAYLRVCFAKGVNAYQCLRICVRACAWPAILHVRVLFCRRQPVPKINIVFCVFTVLCLYCFVGGAWSLACLVFCLWQNVALSLQARFPQQLRADAGCQIDSLPLRVDF